MTLRYLPRPLFHPAALAALAIALALGACGSDDSSSGPLTVYSGRSEELIGPLVARYENRYDTDVEVRYGDTSELASTLLEEGDNTPADLFFSQDAGALGALEKEGRLAQLPDDLGEAVDRRYRSRAGRWVATSARARVVAYNRDRVQRSELPRSILDFTDDEWNGRIGWAPTNGSFQAFVTALRELRGDDRAREWLEGIVANDPERFDDNEPIRDALAKGELDVGFINHYYVAQAQAEEGSDYPVEVYFPPAGDPGSLVNVAGLGILESGGERDEAERFIRFMLSRESQEHFANEVKEYPLAAGVAADRRLVPLEEIEQPDIDLSNLDDLRGTLTMIEEAGAL
jgi:iron(III) transport system substrate-binding protein